MSADDKTALAAHAGAAGAARAHYAGGVVDDVMVVGVGGQGVIMAAAIIADTAMLGGLDVKLSETRGMSQRGGSVSSHIRIGETVVAPSISPGEVDYLLAFESAEGLRLAPSLVPGGVAIVNLQQIVPPLASQGEFAYPFDAIERMRAEGAAAGARAAGGEERAAGGEARAAGYGVIAVDGNAVGEAAGSIKVTGVVLVGALSTHLPFAAETWEKAIAANVPASFLEMNLAAFAAGRHVGAAEGGEPA